MSIVDSGFRVLDSNGNVKTVSLGAGGSLTDPVTVVHGGTGQTSYAKGDLLYASADGVYSKLPISSSAAKVLTNTGATDYLTPAWSDFSTEMCVIPRLLTRKAAWFAKTPFTSGSFTPVAWSIAATGNTTLTDTYMDWLRLKTTNVADNQSGVNTNQDWAWLDHLPKAMCHFRTGPDISGIRIYFFISDAATFPASSDSLTARKGVGIRYSTVASDTGWMPWTSDGTTQTIGTKIANIAASTQYSLEVEVTSTTSARMRVNDSAYQTVTIGSGALGTACRVQVVVTTTAASIKILDFGSMYGECN